MEGGWEGGRGGGGREVEGGRRDVEGRRVGGRQREVEVVGGREGGRTFVNSMGTGEQRAAPVLR